VAVEITGRYTGQLKTEMTHGPSGVVLRTAAPVDNQGDGSSFSPTDLVAAALASCMVTTLAIARLPVEIHLPASLAPAERVKLERAAQTCPVHRSLGADVEHDVRFVYDVEK
jgi:putative redox protein